MTQIIILHTAKSYSGRVIGDCRIEGYQYCVPFHRAFELLLAKSYTAFMLKIDSNAVCIYLSNEGKFKIFDSHSRDKYGRSHPLGTCVLLEPESINNVTQSLYSENSQFELKAVVIKELGLEQASGSVEMNVTETSGSTNLFDNFSQDITDITCSCKQCSPISLYSICYSILKPSNYWD